MLCGLLTHVLLFGFFDFRMKFIWCLELNATVHGSASCCLDKCPANGFVWDVTFSMLCYLLVNLSLNDNKKNFSSVIRYHYNVADGRLAQHVERGNADGLFITCITSCSNLWALIMDARTGFTNQVYELSPFFLHKVAFPSIVVHSLSPSVWQLLQKSIIFFFLILGMDHGTMGEELLHKLYCWCQQWKFPCGDVQRYGCCIF